MKRSTISWTLLVLILAIIIGASLLVPLRTIEVHSTANHAFVMDVPMPRVRKILVRTNSIKKIVSMANARLLDQQWLQVGFDVSTLLRRDWRLQGSGQLTVQSNDSYIGQHDIVLNQSIDIMPQRLSVINDLDQPSGPIRQYYSTLLLKPSDDETARLESTLELRIRTRVSFINRRIVQREIEYAAKRSLEKQEQAIREIVSDHADNLIILPKRGEQKKDPAKKDQDN